jgi:hypothetical protein
MNYRGKNFLLGVLRSSLIAAGVTGEGELICCLTYRASEAWQNISTIHPYVHVRTHINRTTGYIALLLSRWLWIIVPRLCRPNHSSGFSHLLLFDTVSRDLLARPKYIYVGLHPDYLLLRKSE